MFKRIKLETFYDPVALLSAIPVSVVVLVGSFLSFRWHAILRQDRDLIVHTYAVIDSTRTVLIAAADAETGQRGFVITGDPAFLEPYNRASRTTIPKELTRLEKLVPDNVQQSKRILRLRMLLDQKFRELAATVQIRSERGFETTRRLVANQSGKIIMDDVRRETSEIVRAEQNLLSKRSLEVQRDEHRLVLIAIGTAIISTLMRFGVAVWRQHLLNHLHETDSGKLGLRAS